MGGGVIGGCAWLDATSSRGKKYSHGRNHRGPVLHEQSIERFSKSRFEQERLGNLLRFDSSHLPRGRGKLEFASLRKRSFHF